MSVEPGMFLFEVVISKVKSYTNGRLFVIKAEFGDVFALELSDPKQMGIKIPDPLPLPPEPPGKKGKKKPKPKGKKGKKGKEPPPPPEPLIQAGQSILFTSTPEVLLQNMNSFPLVISIWNKEDCMSNIGSATIPWDPVYVRFLQQIYKCEDPAPIQVADDYNIFEEGTAKLIAQISLQVKLSNLKDKVTTCFRTLSEEPNSKKYLYTGYNSKTTSYMCTLKTTDEHFDKMQSKILSRFNVDKAPVSNKVVYAVCKNAAAPNMLNLEEDNICCNPNADKPPNSIYKVPETFLTIEAIDDYIRKTIRSCNDNLRMLKPRPTIRPRVKATDMDRLCYCKETTWPSGEFATRFRKEVQGGPCPICIEANKPKEGPGHVFDIANLRGPCGRPDCKVARYLRGYIQELVDEDKEEIVLDEIVGPCGSKTCTVASKIKSFLRHEGEFKEARTLPGLSTQCACDAVMKDALTGLESCSSKCSANCAECTSDSKICDGPGCVYKKKKHKTNQAEEAKNKQPQKPKVYTVCFFTVEYNFEKNEAGSGSESSGKKKNSSSTSSKQSYKTASDVTTSTGAAKKPAAKPKPETKSVKINPHPESSKPYKFCSNDCPSANEHIDTLKCSKSICSSEMSKKKSSTLTSYKSNNDKDPCVDKICRERNKSPPSPNDYDVVIRLDDIHPACCIESCNVADTIKNFIADGILKEKRKAEVRKYETNSCFDAECYCDCDCKFNFSSRTTYCPICGGYECLGDDMMYEPEFRKPHPCPVYNDLYDKQLFKMKGAYSEDKVETRDSVKQPAKRKMQSTKADTISLMSRKSNVSEKLVVKIPESAKPPSKKKAPLQKKKKKPEPIEEVGIVTHKSHYRPMAAVPKNMGWQWKAEDIPGMKPRPKWKPGAANKILVRRYRAVRDGMENILKKKRALLNKRKKLEMKPTVVVKKTDGEFTVQMEVFRKYSKERMLNQYPYDDKPPLIYTVGKTQEEKTKIQRHRDRIERRDNRRKSKILQSTFRDKCQEICLKAYNAAIGLLPVPNPNAPNCPCHTDALPPVSPPMDSCSCSEEFSISTDDTDGDDWIVEFTPPSARWDPKARQLPSYADGESQYNYLDFRVKVLDKSGNQVPRYFKGPDGKQECSDLGGFWGPGHVWLEINKDGFIGPDNRWAPFSFIGPDGIMYSSEDRYFTDTSGKTYQVGVDGYIDQNNRWVHYPQASKPKPPPLPETKTKNNEHVKKNKKGQKLSPENGKSAVTIQGKNDKSTRQSMKVAPVSATAKSNINPKVSEISSKLKNPLIMSASVNLEKYNPAANTMTKDMKIEEAKKIARYKEILKSLELYEDLGVPQIDVKANRASNTAKKPLSANIYGLNNSWRGRNTETRLFLNKNVESSCTRTSSSTLRYQA